MKWGEMGARHWETARNAGKGAKRWQKTLQNGPKIANKALFYKFILIFRLLWLWLGMVNEYRCIIRVAIWRYCIVYDLMLHRLL